MLNELGVEFVYREYRDDPLSEEEIRGILKKLGCRPRDVLRPKEAGVHGIDDGTEDDVIVAMMATEPTLLQRPICLFGDRAILARPADELRAFLGTRGGT